MLRIVFPQQNNKPKGYEKFKKLLNLENINDFFSQVEDNIYNDKMTDACGDVLKKEYIEKMLKQSKKLFDLRGAIYSYAPTFISMLPVPSENPENTQFIEFLKYCSQKRKIIAEKKAQAAAKLLAEKDPKQNQPEAQPKPEAEPKQLPPQTPIQAEAQPESKTQADQKGDPAIIEFGKKANRLKLRARAIQANPNSKVKKVLFMDMDQNFFGIHTRGVVFSSENWYLLNNIREREKTKKLILDWIDQGGVVCPISRGCQWKIVTPQNADLTRGLDIHSGSESIELHFKALLGADYERVKNNIVIKAFYVAEEAYETRVNVMEEKSMGTLLKTLDVPDYLTKCRIVEEEQESKKFTALAEAHGDIAKKLDQFFRNPENNTQDKTVLLEDQAPFKVEHLLFCVEMLEMRFPEHQFEGTYIDDMQEELDVATIMMANQFRKFVTINCVNTPAWRDQIRKELAPQALNTTTRLLSEQKLGGNMQQPAVPLKLAEEKETPISILKKMGNPDDRHAKLMELYNKETERKNQMQLLEDYLAEFPDCPHREEVELEKALKLSAALAEKQPEPATQPFSLTA